MSVKYFIFSHLLPFCLFAFLPLPHVSPAGCKIAYFSPFLYQRSFLKASLPLCVAFNVHFPLVTRGNIDEEGQVGLWRTKGWRSITRLRKANGQGTIVGYAVLQHTGDKSRNYKHNRVWPGRTQNSTSNSICGSSDKSNFFLFSASKLTK